MPLDTWVSDPGRKQGGNSNGSGVSAPQETPCCSPWKSLYKPEWLLRWRAKEWAKAFLQLWGQEKWLQWFSIRTCQGDVLRDFSRCFWTNHSFATWKHFKTRKCQSSNNENQTRTPSKRRFCRLVHLDMLAWRNSFPGRRTTGKSDNGF